MSDSGCTHKESIRINGWRDKLIVLVDNEPAVQNVTRFAEGKNCEVKSEKISDNEFKIEIMAENYTPADEEEEIVCAPSAKDDLSSLYHPTRWDKERKLLVRH